MLGFLFLLLVAAVVTASPMRPRADYGIKEKFHVPRGWSRLGPAPAEHVINLRIGLKQGQFAELEKHLYEVSDPSHERYGQHLSADEVNELIKPTDQTLDLVHDWLAANGVLRSHLEYSPAKDWIKVSLPVNHVETLLDTEYAVYQHKSGGHVVRTPEWSLPLHLHEHIQAIQPTNSFFRAAPRRSSARPIVEDVKQPLAHQNSKSVQSASALDVPSVDNRCNTTYVTPECLRIYYGTYDYVAQVPGKNKIGLTNYLNETSKRSDVKIFLEQFRPDAVSAADNFTIEVINGGDNTQTPNTPEQNEEGKNMESNLDAETILGIGYPTPLITYNTGGSPPFYPDAVEETNSNEPYLDWVLYVLNQTDVPQVISTSYGEDEQTVPTSYAITVCRLFAQLGARGVSLLFASGDAGVGDEGYCISNNGTNATTFLPSFPDGCPYVTSVGATTGFSPEVAAYDVLSADSVFTSGGGFSNYFARPSYQAEAVQNYSAAHLADGTYAGLYNASGRAYPDIAAQGQMFVTTWEGSNIRLDGTSASTPLASAIISLVNDALIAAGKSPLGFLNPWLYQGGWKSFRDITNGSAAGCGVEGFIASAGWDPITGFGTPDFAAILESLGLEYHYK
ncbi:putative tripeptidyl-peptidase 1 precursor [Botryosphaeria dothidea]|uniref:tripeptidyl-peptidase II n=1 Tax=Botryosphaeria dothidea TaxID=55169 RepID=A0A8H4ILU9_9PEZI|nr:putative tripeptidyl-peptidase 1 precursor [Botryosphaeria dothidea]KAF4305728.1 putative tripeptidyl-peptidase 1 precursor [Botryosphaeria dothidea]